MASPNAITSPVLTCWKDISQYLGKSVRTVQRWEHEFDLPIRRLSPIDHKSAVSAKPSDLDFWLKTRWSERTGKQTSNIPTFADEALPHGDTPLSELIQTHRELRLARTQLHAEVSMALNMLKHNCAELHERLKS